MLAIDNVLCPVDFSGISEPEIRLARSVCARFDARLVLQHNVKAPPPDFLGPGWMWSETHPSAEELDAAAAEGMRTAMAGIDDVAVEGRITRGPVDQAIPRLAREIPADLIVMATHDHPHPEHDSVTERILRRAACPVLTIHRAEDEGTDEHAFVFGDDTPWRVVAAVGFTRRGRSVLDHAFALALDLPVELHLLHVEPLRSWRDIKSPLPTKLPEQREERLLTAEARLEELIPARLQSRTTVHVASGSVGEEILRVGKEIQANLIVSGVPGTRRTWLRRSTSLGLLHDSACPVWYVPRSRSLLQGAGAEASGSEESS